MSMDSNVFDFHAEIKEKDITKRGLDNLHDVYLTYHFLSLINYLPGISLVCAPNIDTQNSNPASISFINIEQNSSGPLSCSLCAKKCKHLMVKNACVALHVPRSQPMQLLVTFSMD